MSAVVASAIIGALGALGSSLFNWNYQKERDKKQDELNQRDFDYQKALQQQIFEREDNAVQRRMADLEAAGLNPNLAAGSAASAGSVVGRSSTNVSAHGDVGNPVGTALDAASAIAQLKLQREQAAILNNQKIESAAKAKLATNATVLDNLYTSQMLGLNPSLQIRNGAVRVMNNPDYDGFTVEGYKDTPMYKQIEWQIQNNKNSAWLLQKDVDYYNTDKLFDYIGQGARAAGNLTGGIGSLYKNVYANPYSRR